MSNGITPASIGANLIRSRWGTDIKRKAYEEPVFAKDVSTLPTDGGKVGDRMYVRILPIITAITPTGSSEMGPESLTWHTGTVTRVQADPTGRYTAVELPITLTAKLDDAEDEATRRGYRDQMSGSINEAMDANGLSLAGSLGTTLGPSNLDKTVLTSALATLRQNAKEHVKNGSMLRFKYHPSQHDNLLTIAEIANAELRGDSENPNVKGFVIKAWGMTFEETGSIYETGGNKYNVLFADSAFGKAFNYEPNVLAPQEAGLTTRFVAYGEWAFIEVFDEDALAIRSAA